MSRRRHRKGSSSFFAGRMILIAIFLLYRAVDVFYYFASPDAEERFGRLGASVVFGLWTTVLLVAMWYRQSWARLVLAGYLILTLIFPSFVLLEYLKARIVPPLEVIIPFSVSLLTLLAILFLPPIRSLTRHRYPNSLDRR